MTLTDPSTGRAVWTGPNGEAGYGAPTGAATTPYTMPDGRTAYYVPGQNIQDGNVMALGGTFNPSYTSYAPGAQGWLGAENQAFTAQQKADKAQAELDKLKAQMGGAQGSAVAILRSTLDQYGLSDLLPWATQEIQNGASSDQVLVQLRDQPAFKQRFPAIFDRQAKGLPPISPAEYVAYEQNASQLLQQYGLPNGMANDKTIITDLLNNDVSPTELKDRLDQGFSAVANGPQTVQDAFSRYYGVQGKGALAAMFLDPARAEPELLRMAQTAGIGGEAATYGLGMGLDQAAKINDAGISSYQRHSDFLQANAWKPLENQTVGEADAGQAAQTDTSLLNASFGLDSMSQLAVTNLLRARNAAVQNIGGQAAETQQGASGLGVSQPV